MALAERLALPLIVLAAAGFAAYYALDVDEWRVMSDELLYVRLALHFGDTLSPFPRFAASAWTPTACSIRFLSRR